MEVLMGRPVAILIVITAMFAALSSSALLSAEEQGYVGYTPTQENLEAREWFQDAKFGLFVHWGVYSLLGKQEWVMETDTFTVEEYEKLPGQFYPVNFDPDEWCRMAKDAGMQYITITSKHHDGFAMYDSKISDYDIVDSTPYGKDVLKMLAEACERHGLKLFFYHSQLDWHHPDYYPRGRTGQSTGRPDSGEWEKYLDYMDAQLAELCTGYGRIGGIWFDGMWDKPDADWRLGKTYKMIHNLAPWAMVGSNHHVKPYPGEDFQMFERGLPGKDPWGKGGVSALPLETCETLNKHWGYNWSDKEFKSVRELIHYLVKAAGNNANFLLNVGPRPDGTIQEEFRERLAAMGDWLETNGESVYGTRGGPVPPRSWGVTTHTGNAVYLHVLSETDELIALPDLGRKVKTITTLDGKEVTFNKTENGLLIKVPDKRDTYDTVLKVQ